MGSKNHFWSRPQDGTAYPESNLEEIDKHSLRNLPYLISRKETNIPQGTFPKCILLKRQCYEAQRKALHRKRGIPTKGPTLEGSKCHTRSYRDSSHNWNTVDKSTLSVS